jgi:hypothetical protein
MLFASMDIFSGEDFYEKHFEFKETDPINTRFDEFGIGDKNFIMNSGSYLIMQVFIVVWVIAKQMLIEICIKMAKFSFFRKLGMFLGEHDPRAIKKASLRLLLESYFDVSICVFINLIAFYECETFEKF